MVFYVANICAVYSMGTLDKVDEEDSSITIAVKVNKTSEDDYVFEISQL